LHARSRDDAIELDFPVSRVEPARAPAGLVEGLGVTPRSIAMNDDFVVAELADESAVRDLDPDLAALRRLGRRGVIATARPVSPTDADFVSRYWAPNAGIVDDPVTGSAHCALAPPAPGSQNTNVMRSATKDAVSWVIPEVASATLSKPCKAPWNPAWAISDHCDGVSPPTWKTSPWPCQEIWARAAGASRIKASMSSDARLNGVVTAA
jgi:hypothetical protein